MGFGLYIRALFVYLVRYVLLKSWWFFLYRSVMPGSAVRLDAWKHENRRFGLVIT